MSPNHLQKIFKRHRGASSEIARELGVDKTTISLWFRGHVQSQRIDRVIHAKAQLLDKERAELCSPQH